jgi:hypothetical protein
MYKYESNVTHRESSKVIKIKEIKKQLGLAGAGTIKGPYFRIY